MPGAINERIEDINNLFGLAEGAVDEARGFTDKVNLDSLNNNYSSLSKSNSKSSNSSSDNNFENSKIDYNESIKKMNQDTKIDINLDKSSTNLDNSNIITIDPNKFVKDKILTNLHCL